MSLKISDKNYPPPPTHCGEDAAYVVRSGTERRNSNVDSSQHFPLHLENGDYILQDRRLQPERRWLLGE
jgi:hypothetical protein